VITPQGGSHGHGIGTGTGREGDQTADEAAVLVGGENPDHSGWAASLNKTAAANQAAAVELVRD